MRRGRAGRTFSCGSRYIAIKRCNPDILPAAMGTTLYIIRHGQSAENTGENLGGDSELTAMGREQAVLTGQWLRTGTDRRPRPTVVVASPALRTVETARAIAEACDVPLLIDPDLCEFGMLYEAPGLSGDQLQSLVPRAELPEAFPRDRGWAEHVDGEEKYQLHERVERSIERYVEGVGWRGHESPSAVAIVSHAHFGGFFLGRLFRIPIDQLSSNRLRLSNCGVSQVTVTHRYRQLEAGNHTAHLDGLDTR